MATPMVSGLVGVMRAVNPRLSAEEIYKVLRDTGVEGKDHAKVGRTIDMDAAVRAVLK